MTVGRTTAFMLYMKKVIDNFGEMSNNFIALSKV
jgi:hypothetical protein